MSRRSTAWTTNVGFRPSNQRSPMFLDMNADGHLDLFVRQGGMEAVEAFWDRIRALLAFND